MSNCKFHNTKHPPKLIEDFKKQCERLKLTIGDRCPIELIMENSKKTFNVLQSEYTILNKNITEVAIWPRNIDLVITRFPATEKDGYSKGLAGYVANKAFNGMNSNTLLYLVVSSLKESKERPFALIDIFTSVGFNFIDTIIWVRNKFTPTQGAKRLNNIYDFVFLLSKGDNYHLDRQSIVYLKKQSLPECEEDYICPGNVWKIKIDDRDSTPIELYESIIKLSNILPNSLIVDPFLTLSTFKASLQLGHSFWGCSENKKVCKDCNEIIKQLK